MSVPVRTRTSFPWAAALTLAMLTAAATPALPAAPRPDAGPPAASRDSSSTVVVVTPGAIPLVERAKHAIDLEDYGIYDSAAVVLEGLRARVRPDPDLDLALAIDRARAGRLEDARALLEGPALTAAVGDSTPVARRGPYGPGRERTWFDGRFDGWRWAVFRARAEVLARLGSWEAAREAARSAAAERPLAGVERLVLALCSARAGDLAVAGREARAAVALDPMLPEAHYLLGLLEWRAGRRAAMRERCAAALALDSLYEPAVRARQRLRFFPAAGPDTFPATLLTGLRAADLLTSAIGPKLDAMPRLDRDPAVLERTMVPIPDTLQFEIPPLRLVLPVLVDERGRAVLCHLPWISPADLPAPLVSVLLESLPLWRFSPGVRLGRPVPSWAGVIISTGAR
jgi:hypothetical protein